MEENELSFGQRACGVSFNPGGHPDVARLKNYFAAMVDTLYGMREMSTDPDEKRMLNIAITEVQTAQMWAVKAITWNL